MKTAALAGLASVCLALFSPNARAVLTEHDEER